MRARWGVGCGFGCEGRKGETDGLGKKGKGNGFVGGGCHIFYKKKFK